MRITLIIIAAASIFVLGILAGGAIEPSAEAQRNSAVRFDYAVVTGSYSPYPPDGPSVVTAAVNICYLQPAGCADEEIKTELNIGKFAQEQRLDTSSRSKYLAQRRAVQNSYSKAISKLGNDGWELVETPPVGFDLYYLNDQGIQTVDEAGKTGGGQIWFKRLKQ